MLLIINIFLLVAVLALILSTSLIWYNKTKHEQPKLVILDYPREENNRASIHHNLPINNRPVYEILEQIPTKAVIMTTYAQYLTLPERNIIEYDIDTIEKWNQDRVIDLSLGKTT